MSLQAHLEALETRHAALAAQIETEQTHPSVDSLDVKDLKRQKLKLKDEINRLRQAPTEN